MPPTPLMTKGTGTLARKWRKIKKRCSSFSSGDAVQRNSGSPAPTQNRSCDSHNDNHDYHDNDNDDDDDVFASHEDEGIAIGELEPSSDSSKLRNLKNKIQQQWNRRRRSSQGDSVSQWWSWQQQQQQPTTPSSTLKRESRPNKVSVIRSGSLKEELRPEPPRPNDDDEEDGFVRADPVRGQHVTVKSAIISTTNPYCTGARVPKNKKKMVRYTQAQWREGSPFASSDTTTSAPSPSPPGSSSGASSSGKESSGLSSLCHDQDSGYDGYCPDKSITSLGSSSNAENLSASSSTTEESHYGNSLQFASSAAIYGRIGQTTAVGRQGRPQSVYEKASYGHSLSGLHPLITTSPNGGSNASPSSPIMSGNLTSHRSHVINRATVVNLVQKYQPVPPGDDDDDVNVPPPLPPRPSSMRPPPPPQTTETKPHQIKQTSASLPRHRRSKKQVTGSDLGSRRDSFPDSGAVPAAAGGSTNNLNDSTHKLDVHEKVRCVLFVHNFILVLFFQAGSYSSNDFSTDGTLVME